MGNQPHSPYFNLSMIRNIEMFFGRTSLLKRFYAALASRQSVSILGQRRIGKSSFLWCASLPEMFDRFAFDLKSHIFVFLDLHDYLDKTREDFFHSVSQEIIDQSAKVAGLTLRTEARGADEFSSILDQVVRKGFFPVLLLDSFDKVTQNEHFGPEFFGFLRAQASRGRVSYVTASIAPLYDVCHRGIQGSPFFNIFYNYTLEALTPVETFNLISIPAERAGLSFTETEVELVRDLAGRHPFFIQRVCHILFEEKVQQDDEEREVNEQHLRKLAYNELEPHFKACWGELPDAQHMQLYYEVRRRDGAAREMPELSESALFLQFVANTQRVGVFQIGIKEVEEALDSLNNSQELGEAALWHMQIVSRRLEGKSSSSAAERGMVIREVLREAFERLRPGNVRSDSASEWLCYNVLYYRYFKHHNITNEQIAARLALGSVRQFYRERTRAIEALLNVLLEMERSVTILP